MPLGDVPAVNGLYVPARVGQLPQHKVQVLGALVGRPRVAGHAPQRAAQQPLAGGHNDAGF